MTGTRATRRQFLKSATAGATASAFLRRRCGRRARAPTSSSSAAASAARAAPGRCARPIRNIRITLVEANAIYTAPPRSNSVIAGLADLQEQQFGYDGIKAAGIEVALSAASPSIRSLRTVAIAGGATLSYVRLVISLRHRIPGGRDPGLR